MSLEAFRGALLTDARERAARRIDEARSKSERRLDHARSRAEEMISEAKADGEQVAAAETARMIAEERRKTREQILTARQEVFENLRQTVERALTDRSAAGELSDLWRRLEEAARLQLGEEADITTESGNQGFVARLGRRQTDYTIHSLVGRALETMGSELERLWR